MVPFETPDEMDDSTAPALKAGLIYYVRDGNNLVGKWSHQTLRGVLANEVVNNVPLGALEGSWPVDIFSPSESLMFRGHINFTSVGHTLSVTWIGDLLPKGQPARFAGIGIAVTSDLIVASFERVDP